MSRLIDSAPPARPVAPRTEVVRQAAAPTRPHPSDGGPAGPVAPYRHREERRSVTVLFVDIVGFTGLCDERDPEDVRGVQTIYFDAVRRVVRSWHGVVEKYIGDAVLAVFGAPLAHEHDAYRAVRAGLDIHRALAALTLPDGSRLRARVGVATGEAVVDLDAVRDGGQALVSGDVVNTAARLQSRADPGAVIVTAATRRATAALVHYERLPPITVAGKPAGLGVWRARGPRPPRTTPARRDPAPLVGRDHEVVLLAGCLAAAVRDRAPRLATVLGPAGIGKSRLVREVSHRVRVAAGAPVQWWVGRCPPCADSPYEPFLAMLRAHAGVRESDQPPAARRKLAAALDDLVGPDDTPAVLTTISSGAEPEHAWRRVLLAAAQRSPLVVVVEDLHDAGPATAQFLRDVVAEAAARSLPLAAVVTWRTSLPDPDGVRRPGPSGVAPAGLAGPVLRLRPLTDEQSGRLFDHLLGGGPRPVPPAAGWRSLAGGNPWYAEEYVHLLGATAGGSVQPAAGSAPAGPAAAPVPAGGDAPVPEPLRRVVAAQLDRLDEPARVVLQAAAALGDVVRSAAVAALLGSDVRQVHATLRRLHRCRVLTRRPDRSRGAQPAWAFADPVVRRVAYDRLPRAVRAEFHRRAAAWLAAAATAQRPPAPHRPAAGAVHRTEGAAELHLERARHWLAAYHLTRALRGDALPCLVSAGDALVAAARATLRAARSGPACAAAPGGWQADGMGLFTVAEARAELHRLRPVLDEVVAIRADAAELAAALREGAPTGLGGLPEWKAAQARLDDLLTEIQRTGAELKGLAPLLLDFPADLDGEAVQLCWLEGDEELGWYHRADLGFAGRRPLA